MTAVGNAGAAPKTVQQNETLRAWVDGNADRLGAGEAARAKTLLREHGRILRRGAPGSAIRLRSVVVLVLGVAAMVFYAIQVGHAMQALPDTTLADLSATRMEAAAAAAPWMTVPAAALCIGIALVSVRIPTPIRVVGGILGLLAALSLLVVTLVLFGNAYKVDAGPALLAVGVAAAVLVVGWAIGARR